MLIISKQCLLIKGISTKFVWEAIDIMNTRKRSTTIIMDNDSAPLAMLTRMFFGPIIAIIFAVLIYQIRGI